MLVLRVQDIYCLWVLEDHISTGIRYENHSLGYRTNFVVYEIYRLAYMGRWNHYDIRPTSVLFFMGYCGLYFNWKDMKIIP